MSYSPFTAQIAAWMSPTNVSEVHVETIIYDLVHGRVEDEAAGTLPVPESLLSEDVEFIVDVLTANHASLPVPDGWHIGVEKDRYLMDDDASTTVVVAEAYPI